MFAMLVIAATLTMFNFVHSRASNEDQFDSDHVAKIFSEDDMTPDFTEQLGSHDHSTDIKTRTEEKYRPPMNEVRTTTKPVTGRNLSEPNALGRNAPGRNVSVRNVQGRNASGRNASRRIPSGRNASGHNAADGSEKRQILQEEIDVVDREDHVTQYLSEQLINTDSEITSLQASETEDEPGDSVEIKEDTFFNFLTGQEKAVEVEGAWSRPAYDDLIPEPERPKFNVISDVEYKD